VRTLGAGSGREDESGDEENGQCASHALSTRLAPSRFPPAKRDTRRVRIVLVGGTGPVGRATTPHLLAAGHDVAVAHSGDHEPPGAADVEHLHGGRDALLASDGAVARWRPEVLVDTFAGGATSAKARLLGDVAEGCGAARIVAVSSLDVYRHCAAAGVDDHAPVELPLDALPLGEDAPRRTQPSPSRGAHHDNVAMENALHGAPAITVLRPGAIYGPYLHPRVFREWYLVGRVARGERQLPLPDGGTQLFHRVATDRVGRAIAAAVERAPNGRWECNVGDPFDFTFGALASLVARQLDWQWEPIPVPWAEGDHPWNVRHPVVADTTRLREVLGVIDPDPVVATRAQIDWLWEHRVEAASVSD
jgi:nucleoside-diphosphate-sugar epimerase